MLTAVATRISNAAALQRCRGVTLPDWESDSIIIPFNVRVRVRSSEVTPKTSCCAPLFLVNVFFSVVRTFSLRSSVGAPLGRQTLAGP